MNDPTREVWTRLTADLIRIDLLIAVCLVLGVILGGSCARASELDYGRACLKITMAGEQHEREVEGMMLVGLVILNRTRDPRWPSDICGVVAQRAQLDGFTRWARPFREEDLGEVRVAFADWAIDRLLNGTYELPGQCVSGKPLLYFHSGPPPWWAASKRRVCAVDNHVFYSEQ